MRLRGVCCATLARQHIKGTRDGYRHANRRRLLVKQLLVQRVKRTISWHERVAEHLNFEVCGLTSSASQIPSIGARLSGQQLSIVWPGCNANPGERSRVKMIPHQARNLGDFQRFNNPQCRCTAGTIQSGP